MRVRFEWDENKRQRNVAARGIDFLRVTQLFDGRAVCTYPSPRKGEPRWVTVGQIEGKFFAVAWTWRWCTGPQL